MALGDGESVKRMQPDMQRAVICGCGCGRPDALRAALPGADLEIVTCATPEVLLELILQRPPDVLLYQLGSGCEIDTGVLRLVRRWFPRLPLIVISEDASLEMRRLVQEFRPMYSMIQPMEPRELRELVEVALGRRQNHRRHA